MLGVERHIAGPAPAKEPKVFDTETLNAIYKIVFRAMNGRTAICGMEADDIVQAILLIILMSKSCGREKIGHLGLVKTIAHNYLRREDKRTSRSPKTEPLPDAIPTRRQPDPLLVAEFLDEASRYLNDTHLELLTLCLEKGYRLDRRRERKSAAQDLGITLDHLRHVLDKLRERHGEFWRQYLSLF